MEPYTETANSQAQENIASCLIQYGEPVSDHDVEILTIQVPNDRPLYGRMNPKSFHPKIVIRNLGRKPLKSLTIRYGTEGFTQKTMKWTGNLPYYGSEEIELPGIIDSRQGSNVFSATLLKPNGKSDAWEGDNEMKSEFTAPRLLPEDLIIQYRTNNLPEENSVYIMNEKGEQVYQKGPEQTDKSTLYIDTLHLTKGFYEMYLTDTAGQGLEFWFMRNQGFGYLRILDLEGHILHLFNPDCGNGEMLAFQTDPNFKRDPRDVLYDFALYPKVVSESFTLEVYSGEEIELEVVLLQDGVPVEKHLYPKTKGGIFKFNIGHLPDNRYIAEVYVNGVLKHKSRCQKASNWQYD